MYHAKNRYFLYSLLTKAKINNKLKFNNMGGELRKGHYGGNYVGILFNFLSQYYAASCPLSKFERGKDMKARISRKFFCLLLAVVMVCTLLPITALAAGPSGSIESAGITQAGGYLKNAVSVELKDVTFKNSVQVKLYSGDTLLTTATLQGVNPGSYGFLTCCIATETADANWALTPWTPKDDVVPDKAVLVVDGHELNTKTFTLDAKEWAALPGTVLPYSGSIGTGVTTYSITVKSSKNGDVTASHKTASKGTAVTLTVDPDKGYVLDTLTVLDGKDKEIKLTEKNGKYTFTMPASKVTVEAMFKAAGNNPFTDVPAGSYYEDAVIWAVGKGITSGTSAVTFDPNGNCTRAQAVTFLWRAAGSPARHGAPL